MDTARSTRAVVAYFVLAFAISWGGIFLVGTLTGMPARSSTTMGQAALVFLSMIAGPSISSIVLTALFTGKTGLRELASRLIRWRVGARWYATLLIGPGLVALVLGALSIFSPAYVPPLFFSEDKLSIVIVAIVAGFGAGIFEELGWTGFVTPRLLERGGVAWTGITLGLVWALWHSLGDYWGAATQFGPLWIPHFLQWFVALVAFRVLMTWVYSHAKSLLLGMLLHASFTGSQSLFWPTDVTPREEMLWYGLFGLALWIVVAIVAAREKGHLLRPLRPIPGH